jgi:hypothetical protein
MTKILPALAAFAMTAMLAGAAPANAAGQRQDGVRTQDQTATDVSSQRRGYRGYYARRHFGPRWGYGGPRYGWGSRAYAYDPYYRPHYGPRAHIGVPGFGVGIGFGPRYW